ncbi:hypothetical protein PLICRDRAFT_119787, partial [Plicaturopsis crispa FD-325 SS-3]
LLDFRLRTCKSRKGLLRHARHFFFPLQASAMSGDETDEEGKGPAKTFRIVTPEWRSAVLTTFLRTVDDIGHENWRSPVHSRAVQGNPPRTRVEVDKPTSFNLELCKPIRGLWRNCYDSAWLASLQPWELAHLEPRDDDYDFTIPSEELTRASANKSRRGVPCSRPHVSG